MACSNINFVDGNLTPTDFWGVQSVHFCFFALYHTGFGVPSDLVHTYFNALSTTCRISSAALRCANRRDYDSVSMQREFTDREAIFIIAKACGPASVVGGRTRQELGTRQCS